MTLQANSIAGAL